MGSGSGQSPPPPRWCPSHPVLTLTSSTTFDARRYMDGWSKKISIKCHKGGLKLLAWDGDEGHTCGGGKYLVEREPGYKERMAEVRRQEVIEDERITREEEEEKRKRDSAGQRAREEERLAERARIRLERDRDDMSNAEHETKRFLRWEAEAALKEKTRSNNS